MGSNYTLGTVSGAGITAEMWHDPNDHIGKHHAAGVWYELDLLQRLAQLPIGSKEFIIDAGANTGNHTVFLSKAFPNAIVHSFEPVTYRLLVLNANENHLKNFSFSSSALSYKFGNYSANYTNNNSGMSTLIEATCGEIKSVTIDTVRYGYRVALIKIDVEGMELEVIRGGMQTIERDLPYIAVECHTEERLADVLELLPKIYMVAGKYCKTPTYLLQPGR